MKLRGISTYLLLAALLKSVAAEITNRHIGRHSESDCRVLVDSGRVYV